MAQQIVVSEGMLEALQATRPWVKFIAIVWFVGVAFMALFGVAMTTGIYRGFSMPGMPVFFGKVLGIFYIVMALVYVMPALYLYRYAKAIVGVQGVVTMAGFEDALKQQKSFWKYFGIFIIIVLALYVLFIFGFMIAGMYLVAHHH